jgi:hypothetical protein
MQSIDARHACIWPGPLFVDARVKVEKIVPEPPSRRVAY